MRAPCKIMVLNSSSCSCVMFCLVLGVVWILLQPFRACQKWFSRGKRFVGRHQVRERFLLVESLCRGVQRRGFDVLRVGLWSDVIESRAWVILLFLVKLKIPESITKFFQCMQVILLLNLCKDIQNTKIFMCSVTKSPLLYLSS